MPHITGKKNCTVLNGLCPRMGNCFDCELFNVYKKLKQESLQQDKLDKRWEERKCGECEHYLLRRIGKNGAEIGECTNGFKKSTHIFGSSKACKKVIYEGRLIKEEKE